MDREMNKIEIKDLKKLIDETARHVETADDPAQINTIIENLITTVVGSESASLWVFDKERATLVRERHDGTLREISMLGQQGVLAKCFFTLSSGIYNYLASEKGYIPAVDNPDNIKIKSKIIVPIIENEHFLGMVTAYSSIKKIKNFEQEDIELLQAMTPFLCRVIYKMYPQIQMSLEPVHIDETRFEKASEKIVEKVEEIQQTHTQTPADTHNDALVQFLANTVHDIRTPANTLYGFLELLEETLEDKRLLQYIHNAKESAHFINELTTSILDRISTQRAQPKERDATLSTTKFFADIAEGFSANMNNKEILFNIYIDPLLPKEISLKSTLLKRVLMNLLNNAYKFTPQRKRVDFTVKYDAQKKQAAIAVTDTGIGIAPEKQEEIFKAFTQAEDSTRDEYGGTGLGLAICADYVRELGGELKLRSELEKGSSFYFTLPLKVINPQPMFSRLNTSHIKIGLLLEKDNIESSKNILRYLSRIGLTKEHITVLMNGKKPEKGLTHLICFEHLLDHTVTAYTKDTNIPLLVIEEKFLSHTQSDKLPQTTHISQYSYYAPQLYKFITDNTKKRVLIVDDDKINIELIKAILSEEFCQIDTAMDGEKALYLLKKGVDNNHPYTLAFIDQHMPKFSGLEVIRKFREYEKKKHTPALFAVSISGDTLNHKDTEVFDGYVNKPFNRKMIKEVLQKACIS
jgi:signal transduction histidine kinase/ActR/RegA family two-component response regulator